MWRKEWWVWWRIFNYSHGFGSVQRNSLRSSIPMESTCQIRWNMYFHFGSFTFRKQQSFILQRIIWLSNQDPPAPKTFEHCSCCQKLEIIRSRFKQNIQVSADLKHLQFIGPHSFIGRVDWNRMDHQEPMGHRLGCEWIHLRINVWQWGLRYRLRSPHFELQTARSQHRRIIWHHNHYNHRSSYHLTYLDQPQSRRRGPCRPELYPFKLSNMLLQLPNLHRMQGRLPTQFKDKVLWTFKDRLLCWVHSLGWILPMSCLPKGIHSSGRCMCCSRLESSSHQGQYC